MGLAPASVAFEWVGALIAAIGVLFDRIDRREDRLQQRTDLLKPLLELYHLVSEWERFAKTTNSKLAAWFHAGTDEERSAAAREVVYAMAPQRIHAVDSGRTIGLNVDPSLIIEERDESELRDLIAIYAPDLEDQFRQVIRLRVGQLRRLQEELINELDPVRAGDDVKLLYALQEWADKNFWFVEFDKQTLRDFERSANQLSELRREIASFIKTHWDPKDVTF
jgi:hypothetical protein